MTWTGSNQTKGSEPPAQEGRAYLNSLPSHPPLPPLPGNSQRDLDGSPAEGLVLRLFGMARTNVLVDRPYNYSHNQAFQPPVEEKKEFLGHDVQLASFRGKVSVQTEYFSKRT